jgi:hypothetical protein
MWWMAEVAENRRPGEWVFPWASFCLKLSKDHPHVPNSQSLLRSSLSPQRLLTLYEKHVQLAEEIRIPRELRRVLNAINETGKCLIEAWRSQFTQLACHRRLAAPHLTHGYFFFQNRCNVSLARYYCEFEDDFKSR